MARMNTLIHEYELFIMKLEDNILKIDKYFTHIVNHMKTLGKVSQNNDMVIKVLICLNCNYQPKVAMITSIKTCILWICLHCLKSFR